MIAHIVAAALLVMQTAPEETPCLTRAEVSDLAITLAPALVGAVANRCRGHVDGTAFLNTGLAAYRSRLEAEAPGHRSAGLRAFAKLAGGEPLAPGQQDAALDLMIASLAAGVDSAVPVDACADVDHILGAIAPLPPENLGNLISAVFALAMQTRAGNVQRPGAAVRGQSRRAAPDLRICPA